MPASEWASLLLKKSPNCKDCCRNGAVRRPTALRLRRVEDAGPALPSMLVLRELGKTRSSSVPSVSIAVTPLRGEEGES